MGKTFCALAAGLEKTEKCDEYSRILVTRSVTATEQYGFLPELVMAQSLCS